ncbi:ODV-E56 [Penaeus vannamei nudivirus]|nr:ODV-E56 [Penaeus vannamei nucleopolyhedrovirus]
MKWLADIKFGSKPLKSVDEFAANAKIVKGAKCDVPAIDNVFENLPLKQVGDEMYVNNARFRDLEPKLRKGEIRSALKDAEIPTTISSADEAKLTSAVSKNAPDLDIAKLESKTATARKYHEDLAVTAKDGTELENALSSKSKEKTKSMYSKIAATVAVGGTAVGLFTAMTITGKVYEDIATANNNRNGCFLVYKNSNTYTCKLISRSCGFGTAGSSPCSDTEMKNTKYNIYLMVHNFFTTANEAAINGMKDAGIQLGPDQSDPTTYSPDFTLTQEGNIMPLLTFYDEYYETNKPIFDPCEMGKVEVGCVACNPTAQTNSVTYTSTELLDENMTYACIKDSTVIDTLTDVATSLGIDLFTASGDSVSGSFQGNFFLTMLIILALIVLVAVGMRFIPTGNAKQASAPKPPLNAYSQPAYRQPMNTPGYTDRGQPIIRQQIPL